MKFFFLLFLPFFLFAKETEEAFLKRIEAHFVLEDFDSAYEEIVNARKIFPETKELKRAYIRALSSLCRENEAISACRTFYTMEELKKDPSLLEEIAWGVLKKGLQSSQYAHRLSSLVGIYFTKDARAVLTLRSAMKDSNAIIRAVALQLACNYRDELLQRQVAELLESEKVWFVRLEVINAVGQMRMKSAEKNLKEILKNEKATFEERMLSVEALVNIYDKIDLDELEILLKSPYAGFRILGIQLGSHFKIEPVKKEILLLTSDPRYDVRMAALNALGFFYKDHFTKKEMQEILIKTYKDSNAFVAITASWLGLFIDPSSAKTEMKKWLFDPYEENRRFASGALSHAASRAKDLCSFALANGDDYVRANVAFGMITQREEVKKCSDFLYGFLKNKKEMWMWESNQSGFQILAPSRIRHTDQLPNYPQAIDQVVQLNILSLLSTLEDQRSLEAVKTFLKEKTWGITGLAAISLLHEGDEGCITVLKELLKDKEKSIRIQAALALAIYGKDKTALPILEEAYGDSPHELKLVIVEAIGNIGNENSFAFLLKVLEEPFLNLKIAAASALIQIANL